MLANASANEAKDELWAIYAWWSCVLVLKMMSLTWFTGQIRIKRQVIHSEEDRIWMLNPDVILCPTGDGHPDVMRIRSVHRKDLETVSTLSSLLAALAECRNVHFYREDLNTEFLAKQYPLYYAAHAAPTNVPLLQNRLIHDYVSYPDLHMRDCYCKIHIYYREI